MCDASVCQVSLDFELSFRLRCVSQFACRSVGAWGVLREALTFRGHCQSSSSLNPLHTSESDMTGASSLQLRPVSEQGGSATEAQRTGEAAVSGYAASTTTATRARWQISVPTPDDQMGPPTKKRLHPCEPNIDRLIPYTTKCVPQRFGMCLPTRPARKPTPTLHGPLERNALRVGSSRPEHQIV